jgi:hypothetical protein
MGAHFIENALFLPLKGRSDALRAEAISGAPLGPLAHYPQIRRTSGPISTFASACSTLESKCGNQMDHSKLLTLVELLNLTFEREFVEGTT